MYDETQRQLAERGIKEVVLYRGVSDPKFVRGGSDLITLKGNALESWSVNPYVAYGFTGRRGYVAKMIVPASRVLSTPRSGFGCADEWEFVLIGNPNGDDAIIHMVFYGDM